MTYHQVDDKGAIVPYPGEVPVEAIAAIERADDVLAYAKPKRVIMND